MTPLPLRMRSKETAELSVNSKGRIRQQLHPKRVKCAARWTFISGQYVRFGPVWSGHHCNKVSQRPPRAMQVGIAGEGGGGGRTSQKTQKTDKHIHIPYKCTKTLKFTFIMHMRHVSTAY